MATVVGRRIEGHEWFAACIGTLAQEAVEELFPGGGVHGRGPREDTVQVEQHGVAVARRQRDDATGACHGLSMPSEWPGVNPWSSTPSLEGHLDRLRSRKAVVPRGYLQAGFRGQERRERADADEVARLQGEAFRGQRLRQPGHRVERMIEDLAALAAAERSA